MGSLGSRPNPPPPLPPPEIIYTNLPPGPDPADPGSTPAERRRQNLLQRSRGRFGTVQTSFRGLLGLSSSEPRKTLLGE